MESENLLAAVFPDQLACLENIAGDREIPDHPLVKQTINDCLTEAMDIDGLESLLRRIETGEIECIARDLPEPSPMAHEILNAKPYAFLDDAPLEERRTQAVYTRRTGDTELGVLDAAAIDKVCAEAWPRPVNADELHDALMLAGAMSDEEVDGASTKGFLDTLVAENRVVKVNGFWAAAERAGIFDEPRELVRGRLEVAGPITGRALAEFFRLPQSTIDAALLALEAEGFVLRGKFHPGIAEVEWCDRRLLARIHRLTLNRLRAEIQPVSLADFQRFLLAWQRVDAEHRANGPEGTEAVLELLDGYELPAAAWEPSVLALRVKEYTPQWLDRLCFTGRIGWGRLSPPQNQKSRSFAPLRSSPIALFVREHLRCWRALSEHDARSTLSPDTACVLQTVTESGALFFGEIVQRARLIPSRVEQALGELAAHGFVTADSFEGLRALLVRSEKRAPLADLGRRRHHRPVTSVEFAGRWSLLRIPASEREEAVEINARVLLRRYGVMFRRLLERESLRASWFELGRIYRRLEARGEIRGGHFVSGVSGEQFALPEAIGLLRAVRNEAARDEMILLSGADPLNLVGVLAPGPRITALAGNRILFRRGVAVAAREAGKTIPLDGALDAASERALTIGKLPPALRPYYA
jgi:ATP-dependent helicase Lhr and Lhr-like helicase